VNNSSLLPGNRAPQSTLPGDLGLGFGGVQRVSVDRANTVLYCERWSATVAFYRELLALDVAHETDWFVEFRLTSDAFVSIADARRATIDAAGGKGITLTLHTDALVATKALLDGRGVATTPITRRWGADVFYCHDPEGHRIEFWSDASPAG
jgi:catechol 2,3-dioxygenase-like lactoylglutathione lyase family enzyme